MRIVLISCVSVKRRESSLAKDMYISPLFKGAYHYAKKLKADRIYILSAKYGILEEDDYIEPYNETLNNKSQAEIKTWATKVLEKLRCRVDLGNDEFIFLAGEKYRKYLINEMSNHSVPLKGLSIGKQLSFYKGEKDE